jgi:hypothetical protein
MLHGLHQGVARADEYVALVASREGKYGYSTYRYRAPATCLHGTLASIDKSLL